MSLKTIYFQGRYEFTRVRTLSRGQPRERVLLGLIIDKYKSKKWFLFVPKPQDLP